MRFGKLRKETVLQGNIKLTMFDGDGNVRYSDTVEGTENINNNGLHLWDVQEVKYMFVGDDGFLHIDFERSFD